MQVIIVAGSAYANGVRHDFRPFQIRGRWTISEDQDLDFRTPWTRTVSDYRAT
jgi:hypothetical protein